MSKTQITTSNRAGSENAVMSARTSWASGTRSAAIASISGERSSPVTLMAGARPARIAPVPQPSSSRVLAPGRYLLM